MNEKNGSGDSFESLLEQSLIKKDNFSIGDEVTGKIAFIAKDTIFVDISGKSEAIIDRQELLDKNEELTVNVGDTIKAYIVAMRAGEIQLTTSIGKGSIAPELLDRAKEHGIPVEGTVVSVVKGGYRVSIAGIECFCPFSQIDVKSPPSPESMLNRTFDFKVTQITERGRNIVLSRRDLLEEKKSLREQELKESLKPGDIIDGKISSIQKFGLFVDIGGIEALVPRSEMSWSRLTEPTDFKPGQHIKARLISADWASGKINLSIKQAAQDPWAGIGRYTQGQQVNGTVTNIIKSGAFVEIEPGVEGFIPVSRMSYTRRVNRPEEAVTIGAAVTVKIIDIKKTEKKISLELVTGEADPWQERQDSLMDAIHTGTVESVRGNGVSVRLANGMLGFISKEECAVKKGTDLQVAYPVGRELKVMITAMESGSKRLNISEIRALKKEERDDYERFMKDSAPAQEAGSSFGNLFKQKFEEMKKEK
jgi:small subunit ribosomal protein S1